MAVHTNCSGVSRRDCLQLGLKAVLGGGLAHALRLRATAAAETKAPAAKSCILIWLDGGPTHYETFDPKPAAPKEFRGEFDAIKTRLPGVYFSQHMQRLAAIAHRLAVVRSIRHDQGNHGAGNHYMMTGAPPRIPFSMPEMSRSGGPNFLGAKFAPFVVSDNPNTPDFRVRDVALPRGLTGERFTSRRDIRVQVDRLARIADKAAGDPVQGLDEHYQQGYQLISSKEAQAAFDIHGEPDRVRDAYGRNSFGQRALLARRLVEAGVPFITLYEGGWDHHTKLFTTLATRLPPFEASIAALIEDLAQRGMLDSTLVLCLGEFGRTPQINKDAGRDHWSNAMSVLFAGGGTPGGQVVGATDAKGFSAVERVLSPENFAATVYHKLGIDPGKILYAPNGRPTHLVSDPTVISELCG
jgi:Protein of unknown function (DUF1501)